MIQLPLHPPAWSFREGLFALKTAITLGKCPADTLEILRSNLEKTYAGRQIVLTAQGRMAIHLALEALKVGEGDEVILPSIVCASVLFPILRLKAVPVFADISPQIQMDLQSIRQLVSSKTRAILVPHLFGGAADIVGIERFAKEHGIGVIDDAAQSFGLSVDRRPLGTFGDEGVLAFGVAKPISSWHGGAWITRSERQEEGGLSEFLSSTQEAKALLAFARSRVWRGYWPWPGELSVGLNVEPFLLDYPLARLGRSASRLASNLLAKDSELREQRLARAELLKSLLIPEDIFVWPHENKPSVWTKLVATLVDNHSHHPSREDAVRKWDSLTAILKRKGMEIAPPYLPLHMQCAVKNIRHRAGDLENTDRLWWKIFALPVDSSLSLKALTKLATVLPQAIKAAGFQE